MEFKTAYAGRLAVQLLCPEVGRTKQNHRDECDINNILARYQKTGVLDFVNKHEGQYGDVSSVEFQSAMDMVAEQKERFAELPSKVRNEFGNDPSQYLEFIATAGDDEKIRLGLIEKAKPDVVEKAAPGVVEKAAPGVVEPEVSPVVESPPA